MTSDVARVFVTGLGVVSTVGSTVDEFWQSCLAGNTVVEPIPPHWDCYYRAASRTWSPLAMPDFGAYGLTRTDLLTLAKPTLLALASVAQAVAQAGLEPVLAADSHATGYAFGSARTGLFVGTGLGAAEAPFNNHYTHVMSGLRDTLREVALAAPEDAALAERLDALKQTPRVNPLVICQTMPNAIAANLAIRLGIRGPADTSCAACASGTVAIGKALRAVRRGELDIAVAGGAEHLADRAGSVFMGFDRLQTLVRPNGAPGTENRPFDRKRSGFLFSEGGAAFAVLESARSVMIRGVKPLAEVLGYGETSDACSIAAIREDNNAIRAMIDAAMIDAGIRAADIDYVNAHGTATEVNDAIEADVIARTFRRDTKVNSTKSILGHTIGAAGALEFVATVLSLQRQTLHVSRNLDDPIADLDFCTVSGPAPVEYAFTQSFGFGGHNAGLVLRSIRD